MRRSPLLMMMLAALLVWWAARVVPQALGLATANVNVGGSLRAGGGSVFIDCTPATASVTVTRPGGNQTRTATLRVDCTNRMNIPVSVNMVSGSLMPPRAAPPTITWSANPVPLAAGNPATTGFSNLTVTVRRTTTAGTYTFTFTTGVTGSNGLDYSETHTATVIVQ